MAGRFNNYQLFSIFSSSLYKIDLPLRGRSRRWGKLLFIIETLSFTRDVSLFLCSLLCDLIRLFISQFTNNPSNFHVSVDNIVVVNWSNPRFQSLLTNFTKNKLSGNCLILSRYVIAKFPLTAKLRPLTLAFYRKYFLSLSSLFCYIFSSSFELHSFLQLRYLSACVVELYYYLCFEDISRRYSLSAVVVLQDCFFHDSLYLKYANANDITSITLQHGEASHKLADTSANLFACMDNRSLDIMTNYLPSTTTPKVYGYSLLNDFNYSHDSISASCWIVTYFDTHPTENINYQLWHHLKLLSLHTKVRFKFRPDATFQKKLKFFMFFARELLFRQIEITSEPPVSIYIKSQYMMTYCSHSLFECQQYDCTPVMLVPSDDAERQLPQSILSSYNGLRVSTLQHTINLFNSTFNK